MIETLLVLGCLSFFILLTIAFQERNIMYKNYPTSCHVSYIPEKENIYMLGPSDLNSSPYNFKTREGRKFDLQQMIPSDGSSPEELMNIIFKDNYTIKDIENNYLTSSPEMSFNELSPEQLIEIILDIESDKFKDDKISSVN